jgi:hypothetical protein
VERNTQAESPVTITANDTDRVYTNEGAAGALTYNLPTAQAGLTFTFIVDVAQNLIVQAGAGDTIRAAATVSAAAGTATSNTIGDVIRLVAINATEWYAISVVGGPWAIV